MKYRYAYIHGFASSSGSYKGTTLAGAFARVGVTFELPDLNIPSFAELTYSGMLSGIDALDEGAAAESAKWRFVGSSMGGYVAARWAELHPDRVDRLMLLCPGFAPTERWPQLIGARALAHWRNEGWLVFADGHGKPTRVGWQLAEDALTHPKWPEVTCPVLIVHGARDEVVPIDSSREYASQREHVRLLELDDDHGLAASVERIADEALALFDLEKP